MNFNLRLTQDLTVQNIIIECTEYAVGIQGRLLGSDYKAVFLSAFTKQCKHDFLIDYSEFNKQR